MSVKISRILHAGYIFESDSTVIAMDPIFENPFSFNCFAFPKVKFNLAEVRQLKFDAVILSHYHEDHCSLDSLNLLDRNTPIYLFCLFEEMFSWIRQMGFHFVFPLRVLAPEARKTSVEIGPFRIQPLKALDSEVDCVFQIEVENIKILNVVDAWIDPGTMDHLEQASPWDLVLWPFQTLREIEVLSPNKIAREAPEIPSEWMEQLERLKPKIIVPSSCQFSQEDGSWLNYCLYPISYTFFENFIESKLSETKVVRMDPGVSIQLSCQGFLPSSRLSWVEAIGVQNLDYEFRPDFKAPSLAELAQKSFALNERDAKLVLDFCRHGLIKSFQALEPTAESYFQKPRVWKLSVIDADGKVETFFYLINQQFIEPLSEEPNLIEWTTEILQAKLWSALTRGESLSSLQIRINEQIFSHEIELELTGVDVIEDPLLRSLYSGVFGAFQNFQLRRILDKLPPH